MSKSVVREIRTPRSVGTGGGRVVSGDPVRALARRHNVKIAEPRAFK